MIDVDAAVTEQFLLGNDDFPYEYVHIEVDHDSNIVDNIAAYARSNLIAFIGTK